MKRWSLALLSASLLSSCVFHTHASDHSGVPGIRGEDVEYQVSTSYAIHGLFIFGLLGNASVEDTVAAFTEEASERGATRTDIQQVSSHTMWYIFPPISFFVHPVICEVQGSVEGTSTEGE